METKKHRRKVNRTIIFMSDNVDGGVKQIRIRPWMFNLLVGMGSIAAGILIGYAVYGGSRIPEVAGTTTIKKSVLENITEENEKLRVQNEELSNKVAILSETVNRKVQDEKKYVEQQEADSLPTEFPLTGSATVKEAEQDGEATGPICIFTAAEGTTVIAAGSGTVTAVEEDETYGHKITIDHGNGYVTVYRNRGAAKVKEGDTVNRGVTLYIITNENTELGYQMMQDGQWIDPMDMIAISG